MQSLRRASCRASAELRAEPPYAELRVEPPYAELRAEPPQNAKILELEFYCRNAKNNRDRDSIIAILGILIDKIIIGSNRDKI